MIKRRAFKPSYCDLIAVCFAIVLFAFFFWRAAYGMNAVDESFYLAVAQRYVRGDRPLVDELQNSTISNLFHVPFYWIFRTITGGTSGIILYMRRLFVAFHFLYFWVLYRTLRPYRIWGFLSAAVVVSYIPWGEFTLSYYTVGPGLLMLIILILFFGKSEPSAGKLFVSGVLFTAAVLFEPPYVLLYVLYSFAVLIVEMRRKRKGIDSPYSFFLNRKYWLYITATAVVCAAVFLSFLSWRSGIGNIFRSLPAFLTEETHDFSLDGNVKNFLASKIYQAGIMFGRVNLLLSVAVCVLAFLFEKKAKSARGKFVLFFLSNLVLLSMCVYPTVRGLTTDTQSWHDTFYFIVTPFPLFAFGFVNYRLCAQKDRKLFVIWIISLTASVIMDSFSDVTCAICGTLAAVPGFLCFGNLLKEYAELAKTTEKLPQEISRKGKQKVKDKRKAIVKTKDAYTYTRSDSKRDGVFVKISVLALAFFLVWECINVYFESMFFQTTDPNQTIVYEKVTDGTYKGIVTTPEFARALSDIRYDMNLIKSISTGPVYHDVPQPVAILELDRPLASCSVWPLIKFRERQIRYFIMYPEKKPDVIYYFNYTSADEPELIEKESRLFQEYVNLLCDGTIIQGKAGTIVQVKKWKDLSDPAILSWVLEHQLEF